MRDQMFEQKNERKNNWTLILVNDEAPSISKKTAMKYLHLESRLFKRVDCNGTHANHLYFML